MDRHYLVFDTETTGLPDWKLAADAAGQPRVASWCMIFLNQNLDEEFRWSSLVRPDGWAMPVEAEAINGLSNERLLLEGSSIEWALSLLVMALEQRRTLVAHNLSFDAKMMRGELRRAGLDRYTNRVLTGVCTMRGLEQACALPHPSRIGRYKFPRLSEAAEIILGETLQGAHNCIHDTTCCVRLLRAMRDRGLLNGVLAALAA